MNLLYEGLIRGYGAAIRLASLFDHKAGKWVQGRKNNSALWEDLREFQHAYWFHCASVGEFEQARPLIEAFRSKWPDRKILLSFFSPSGYELRKNYPFADRVVYLPLDTHRNAKHFVEALEPRAAFFIKYEFWPNFLQALRSNEVPTYLVSGIFRPEQALFKSWSGYVRRSLSAFTRLYVQNQRSKDLLNGIGIQNVDVCGDTRFDRVIEIARDPQSIPDIEKWTENGRILVAGSTWEEDDTFLIELLRSDPELKMIIAPHEINKDRILWLEQHYKEWHPYLLSEGEPHAKCRVLIVDSIGLLSSLYAYGQLAYVGGGFGKGIHNLLEAAVFDLAVIFGPKYEKFQEAHDLLELGGGFSFQSREELISIYSRLEEDREHLAGRAAGDYVRSMAGATDFIIQNMPD